MAARGGGGGGNLKAKIGDNLIQLFVTQNVISMFSKEIRFQTDFQ